MVRPTLALLAVLALGAVGCDTHYTSLSFRPVDTSSQLTVSGVTLTVNGRDKATSDVHGMAYLQDLHPGDTVILSKPGYEPARLDLGLGEYTQRSPATDSKSADDFTLHDRDAIPVPLHRQGAVRRP